MLLDASADHAFDPTMKSLSNYVPSQKRKLAVSRMQLPVPTRFLLVPIGSYLSHLRLLSHWQKKKKNLFCKKDNQRNLKKN